MAGTSCRKLDSPAVTASPATSGHGDVAAGGTSPSGGNEITTCACGGSTSVHAHSPSTCAIIAHGSAYTQRDATRCSLLGGTRFNHNVARTPGLGSTRGKADVAGHVCSVSAGCADVAT